MHRRAVAALGILVITASVFIADPASAAGKYGVTLTSSRTVADVGQVTVLSGKVTGTGAGKKKVAVDVKIGAGAWKRVGTTRTTKKGKYSFKARVSSAGTVSYRVVAPKRKKVAAGTSPAVSLQAWRWLDLYDESYLSGGGVISRGVQDSVRIGGKKPAAHSFAMGGSSYLYWNLAQQCDRIVAQVGLTDGDGGETRGVRFQQDGVNTDIDVTGGEALKGFANLSASSVSSLVVARPDNLYTYLVLPRAHCKVNALPIAID
ncbi:hypothetical protein ABIE44_000902 [Marmoricola sp. OAE513]|uniref:hypothetical protein n=1 Tax=Marmoricola sp. OAE513 TaxID=2817894 RepID=UPI001AEAEA5D